MGVKNIDKECKQCSRVMINVDASKMFCEKCNGQRIKNSKIKYSNNNKKQKYKRKEYDINFKKYCMENYALTTKGFNELSSIKTQSYRNFFGLNWYEIVKKYNKDSFLKQYVCDEFLKFYKKIGC